MITGKRLPIFTFYRWPIWLPWAVLTHFDAFIARFTAGISGKLTSTWMISDVWGAVVQSRKFTRAKLKKITIGHRVLVLISEKMDDSYEECFADDESDCRTRAFSRDEIHNEQRLGQIQQANISDSTAENECVFDTDWALKRRYSLSSLLYSRFLTRLEDRMKTFLVWVWLGDGLVISSFEVRNFKLYRDRYSANTRDILFVPTKYAKTIFLEHLTLIRYTWGIRTVWTTYNDIGNFTARSHVLEVSI